MQPLPRILSRGLRYGAILALTAAVLPSYAIADDIKIDSLSIGPAGQELELKGIEVLGSSLNRDELTKLLMIGTPQADRVALASKLKASSASISEIVAKAPDAGNLALRGFKLENVADGKIGRLSLAGLSGTPTIEGQPSTVKAGALTIDDIDVSTLLSAAQSGSIDDIAPKAARLSWNGFEFAFPDKDTPADAPGGNTIKVTLGAMDAQSTYQGNTPLAGSGGLRNLVIDFPKASQAGKQLAAAGFDKVDVSLTYRGAFDPAKKAFQLDDLTLSGASMGALGLRMELGGFDPSLLKGSKDQKLAAMMGVDFASTELRVVNSGLFEKAIAMIASQQGATPEALRSQWAAAATQMLPMLLGGDAGASQVGNAVASFINNPKSLTITLKGKNGPVKIASLAALSDPMAVLQLITISAAAEGGSAPAPAASAPQTAQVAPQAAQGGRKLIGLEAWNQIVGNSVSGKSDDGDPLTEYYLKNGSVKQLIDDDVTSGKWAVKGQQVCIVYDDDDDDDETCYKVELSGDIVTFTDTDGKGKRYTLLKGNPKKL